jgi:hypothetical protein
MHRWASIMVCSRKGLKAFLATATARGRFLIAR